MKAKAISVEIPTELKGRLTREEMADYQAAYQNAWADYDHRAPHFKQLTREEFAHQVALSVVRWPRDPQK